MFPSDETLLALVRQGDRGAFEAIYERHKDAMLTVAACLLGGDCAAAEDVLHDVFVAFARRADGLSINGSLRGYLVSCALNAARDVLRQRSRARRFREQVDRNQIDSNTPAELARQSEDSRRVWDALESLPAEQREVVTLHIHGQLKFREIAGALDVSINTVKSRYRYALSSLRTTLHETTIDGGGRPC